MLKMLPMLILMLAGMRMLYLMELMPVRGGTRLVFLGNICGERTRCRASFQKCEGYLRRVARLTGGNTYRFDLDGKITRGSLTVVLWDDRCRTRLLELHMGESGRVEISKTMRCRLEFRMKMADGNFDLQWQAE